MSGTSKIKSVCVYCGSNFGDRPEFSQGAVALAQALIARDIDLVFGGISSGLMKIVADELMKHGKTVTGVITQSFVEKGMAHSNITKTIIVDTMTQRKNKMMELADGFLALPGGLGTFDEFFEVLILAQLGILPKPCGILNTASFYDLMIKFLDQCVENGFVKRAYKDVLFTSDRPGVILDGFSAYNPTIALK